MITSGTGAAGGSDSWIRFMKLAEEARMRNGGLTTNAKKQALNSSTSFPGLPLAHIKSAKTLSDAFSVNATDVKKKILGAQFDTYA